jgi:hypothetical protein
METCIIIPSHINNINRTKLLMHCLQSLIDQTSTIPIYLSISFESDLDKRLFEKLIEKNNLLDNKLICIYYQERQTSQFRHIEKVINNIKNLYKYIMFCDDDDTYEKDRVEKFLIMIRHGFINCPKDKIFVGVYEMDLYKGSHSLAFYEYWSYCVKIDFIINFINIIKTSNYDYVIDNHMCDVLFSTYLRMLNNKHIFVSINKKLYNYNRNEHSITKKISEHNKIQNSAIPEKVYDFKIFIKGLNEFLEENMETFKNNIFVKYTMCKISFETMLNEILRDNYKYKNDIDKDILKKLKFEYDNIERLCNILYQHK